MLRLLVALGAVGLLGCSPGPPRSITWADVQNGKELNGQTVILEGYPGVLHTSTDHKGTQSFAILSTSAGTTDSAQQSVVASAPAGTGPNQVEQLPEQYTTKDLKIHCADGTVVGTRDKVRVEGKAEFVYGLTILVKKIDKI